MSVTTMTISNLCVSPYNCRINEHDANSVVGMAESLLKRGQLYPLVVHPMGKGKKRQYGALAGGRRFRAFSLLVNEGKLPADHPIDVIVRDITDEGELRELSLAENLVRIDLRPYEVFAAVARAHAKGRSIREIAETNGQTVGMVQGWARLGSLHPQIFAALEAGQISQEQARAYGATAHQDLQMKVFAQLSTSTSSPATIRRMLKVGDSEQTKLLRFVGEKAYADAGGRYELDLFADQAEERGRIEDEALLMKLAEAKLEKTRVLLRAQVQNHIPGRALRFEAQPPRDPSVGGIALHLEVSVRPAEVAAQDADRVVHLRDQMADLISRAEEVFKNPALDEAAKAAGIADLDVHFGPLEIEEAEIDLRRSLPLPAGDIFATLEIDQDGALEPRFWWASRKAKRDAEKPAIPAMPVSTGPIAKPEAAAAARSLMPRAKPGGAAIDNSYGYAERQKADAAIKDEHGVTADGVQIMRALRREVLRCGLIDDAERDGTYGSDYAVWCLLRFELADAYGSQLGARRLASGNDTHTTTQLAIPHVKRSVAGMRWEKERAQLRDHTSMTLNDLPVAFDAFHNETSIWKNKAAAFLAGLMLERSLAAPGYQVPLHDRLAAGAGLRDEDIRLYAEPTEELIDLLPKAHRLALAQPHVDQAAFTSWGKLKAGDLTAPITRALRKAKHWVHPLMRFEARRASRREAAE